MNLNSKSYDERLKRFADEFLRGKKVMASNGKSGQKPSRRIQELAQCAEELTHLAWKIEGLLISTTLLVLLLLHAIDFLAQKIPHPSLSNSHNTLESERESIKEVPVDNKPLNVPTEPVKKSDNVAQTSGPPVKHTAEKSGNGSTSPISKKLTRQPPNPSFIRTRGSSNSHVAGSGAVIRPRAVAETRSRQLPPRSTLFSVPGEYRYFAGGWHQAKLSAPNHPSPGIAGRPMNQSR